MTYKGDKYIIGQVLEGKINAFSHLVDAHKDRAFNLAFRICGNREEAEEVAQDAFLKAYRSLKTFKMESSFSTWLYRIVFNTAISLVRNRKNKILSVDEFPAGILDFLTYQPDVEEAEKEFKSSLVNFALQKLNEEDRALISLYYYEEMDQDEISKITGISRQNMKVRLFRARQKMTETIERVKKKNISYNE